MSGSVVQAVRADPAARAAPRIPMPPPAPMVGSGIAPPYLLTAASAEFDLVASLRVRLEDERTEDALDAIRHMPREQADRALNDTTIRRLAVKAFDKDEMGTAVLLLHGAAIPSLQMLWAEKCGWKQVEPFLRSAPPGLSDVLPNDGMREGFADALDDAEIVQALTLLPGPLPRKLDWLRAEKAHYDQAAEVIDASPKAERPSVYDHPDLREWFVAICDNREMRYIVRRLGGTVRQQLNWMRAEGTDWKLLLDVVGQVPSSERGALLDDPDVVAILNDDVSTDELHWVLDFMGGPISRQMEFLRARGADQAPTAATRPPTLDQRDVRLLEHLEGQGALLDRYEALTKALDTPKSLLVLSGALAWAAGSSGKAQEVQDTLISELSSQGYLGAPDTQIASFLAEIDRFESMFLGFGLQTAIAMLADNRRIAVSERTRYKGDEGKDLLRLITYKMWGDLVGQVAIRTTWSGVALYHAEAGRYPILAHPGLYTPALIDIMIAQDAAALDDLARAVADDVIENIGKTRAKLLDDTDKLWQLDGVIEEAKQSLGIVKGSIFDRLIQRKLDRIHADDTFKSIAIAALAITLGLLSGGTGAVAVLAAAGMAAISVAGAVQSWRQHSFTSAAHGSAIDPARALSQVDSSILWFALDVIGAFLDLGAFAKSVKALGKAAETLAIAGEAAQASRITLEGEARVFARTELRVGRDIVSEEAFVEAVVHAAERRAAQNAALKADTALTNDIVQTLRVNGLTALEEDREALAGLASMGRDTVIVAIGKFGHEPELLARLAHIAGSDAKLATGLRKLHSSVGDAAFENVMRDLLLRRDPGRATALLDAVASERLTAAQIERLGKAGAIADPARRTQAVADELERSLFESTGLHAAGSQAELAALENTRGLQAAKIEKPADVARLGDEWSYVEHARPLPVDDAEYVAEVALPNGHTWRRKSTGQWCRFSDDPFCLTAAEMAAFGEGPETGAVQISNRPGWHEATEEMPGRTGPRTEWYERRLDYEQEREAAAQAGHGLAADLGNDRIEYVSTSMTERTPAGRAQVSAVTPEGSAAGHEFENQFRLTRTGTRFKPDGLEPEGPGRFWFLDNKAQLSPGAELTPEAVRSIENEIHLYTEVQRELADRGCLGLTFLVDSAERFNEVARIRAGFPESVRRIIRVRLRR